MTLASLLVPFALPLPPRYSLRGGGEISGFELISERTFRSIAGPQPMSRRRLKHSRAFLPLCLFVALVTGILAVPGGTPGGLGLQAADLVRPCGPDSLTGPLRKLVPQGVAGADFRPACVRHDACYDTYGANKVACDRKYLREMQCACKNSRRPILCRFTARVMYAVTRRGGDRAYEDAQRIAKEKLFGR